MVRTPARRSGAPWSPPARRPPSGGARSRRALGPCGRPAFEVAGARRTARGRRGNEISTTGLYAVRPSSCRVRTMVASAPRSVAAARRRSSRARRRRRRTMPSANDALQPSQAQRGVAVGVPEASVLQVCGRVRRAFVGSLEGRRCASGGVWWRKRGATHFEFSRQKKRFGAKKTAADGDAADGDAADDGTCHAEGDAEDAGEDDEAKDINAEEATPPV